MTERQIILDTETTGLDHREGHRIIEVGCIELIRRRQTDQHFHVYLQPDRHIDDEAIQVHGITNESLRDQPRFAEIAEEFLNFIQGAELVIHNASFDLGFLDHELQRCGRGQTPLAQLHKITDTLRLARSRHPGQRNTLDALCKRYNIDNSQRTLHGALLDAEILAEVYLTMTRRQNSLFGDEEDESTRQEIRRLVSPADRPPLPVLRASPEEAEEHARYLEMLDKKSGGQCLWKQLEMSGQ